MSTTTERMSGRVKGGPVSREYWSNSSDPHRCGPITIVLAEDGLAVYWTGAESPILRIKLEELITLVKVENEQAELDWIREEAKGALFTIKEARQVMEDCRNEIRATLKVVANQRIEERMVEVAPGVCQDTAELVLKR